MAMEWLFGYYKSNDWLLQPAKSTQIDEKFFPSQYLSCASNYYNNDTERFSRGGDRSYPYIPDEMKHLMFREVETKRLVRCYEEEFGADRLELEVDTLMHLTNRQNFFDIEKQGLLEASPKIFNSDFLVGLDKSRIGNFVWFSVNAVSDRSWVREKTSGRQKQIAKYFYFREEVKCFWNFDPNSYATTLPFCDGPVFWEQNYGFTFKLNDLLSRYCSIVNTTDCLARRFGTMTYRSEVMFPVLIHPDEENLNETEIKFIRQFSNMAAAKPSDAEACLYNLGGDRADNTHWFWKPFSTSSEFDQKYKRVCRWDHPTFAFYFPPGFSSFDISDLDYDTFRLETDMQSGLIVLKQLLAF